MDAGHSPPEPHTPPALRLLWPEMAPEDPDQPLDNETAVLAERRAKVYRLYTRGLSIRAIADHPDVKCSKSTVGRDVQHVAESYRLIALQDAAAHVARELGKLATAEAEAWEAWDRSKGEQTETSTARRDGRTVGSTASVKKRQRDGNPHFLKLALVCVDRRCRLLGLLKDGDFKPGDPMPPVKLVSGVDPTELV